MGKDDIRLASMRRSDLGWIKAFMRVEYPRAYAHLWRDGGVQYVEDTFSESALLEELAVPGAELHQVWVGGAPVGFMRVVIDQPPRRPGRFQRYVYLHRIYLAASIQGRGVGRYIFETLPELAPSCDGVWLDSMERGPAVRFYEKIGFRVLERLRLEHPQVRPAEAGMVSMERSTVL